MIDSLKSFIDTMKNTFTKRPQKVIVASFLLLIPIVGFFPTGEFVKMMMRKMSGEEEVYLPETETIMTGENFKHGVVVYFLYFLYLLIYTPFGIVGRLITPSTAYASHSAGIIQIIAALVSFTGTIVAAVYVGWILPAMLVSYAASGGKFAEAFNLKRIFEFLRYEWVDILFVNVIGAVFWLFFVITSVFLCALPIIFLNALAYPVYFWLLADVWNKYYLHRTANEMSRSGLTANL